MFPELFRIPILEFSIYTYGFLLAMGIWAAIWLAARFGVQDGLDKDVVISFAIRVIIASLIGAKVMMIYTEWDSISDWRSVLSLEFLRAGGVYYGGFLAGLATAAYLIWHHRMPGWKVADAFAPAIALGQSIGRLGCFAAGCCWGKPTSSWVGVTFPQTGYEHTGVPSGVPLHPTQLYESFLTLLIFFFLVWLRPRRQFPGQIVLTYIVLYALARFSIEFYRGDWRGWVGPLSTSQFIAVTLAVGAVVALILRRRRGERNVGLQTADLRPQSDT